MAYTEKEERKKAFIVFASSYEEAMKYLTKEERGEYFELLGRFAFYDEEVHSKIPMVDMLLGMTIPNMIAAEKRHQIAVANGTKGKAYGKQGGRPRKNETGEETKPLNNPRITPMEPLNKETNTNNKTDRYIDENIDKYIDENIDKYIDRYIERNRERESEKDSDITNLTRIIIKKQREDKQPSYLNISDSVDSGHDNNKKDDITNYTDIRKEPTHTNGDDIDLIGIDDFDDPDPDECNVMSIDEPMTDNLKDSSPIAIEDDAINYKHQSDTSPTPINKDIATTHKQEHEMSIFDYNKQILMKKISELVDIKKNNRTPNDTLFYQAADLYMFLYPSVVKDIKQACQDLNSMIDDVINGKYDDEL